MNEFTTDNLQVKATERFSFGWNDWRLAQVSGQKPIPAHHRRLLSGPWHEMYVTALEDATRNA